MKHKRGILRPTVPWDEMQTALRGIGINDARIREGRICLPRRITRLGAPIHVPWLVCLWNRNCVLALAESHFEEFMKSIRSEFSGERAVLLDNLIIPSATIVKLDGRGRWYLPVKFWEKVDLGEWCRVVTKGVALEFWRHDVYDHRWQRGMDLL